MAERLAPARYKNYSQAQVAKVLEEVNCEEKVVLFCGKHGYVAELLLAPGIKKGSAKCQECWQAYYTKFLASMPPHTRQQILESLQEFAHETVQNPDEFKQFLHPEVEIIKGTN